jgi:hypothetical protein
MCLIHSRRPCTDGSMRFNSEHQSQRHAGIARGQQRQLRPSPLGGFRVSRLMKRLRHEQPLRQFNALDGDSFGRRHQVLVKHRLVALACHGR